jgi:hypothetical protein
MVSEVEQVHFDYPDVLYVGDYYRKLRSRISWWSRHLDLIIALGSSGGGATGFIGMVAKIPQLAWICGPLTITGAALAVAKPVYGWGKDIDAANKVIDDYGKLSMQYRFLIDDLNITRQRTADFARRAAELRQTRLRVAPSDFPDLDLAIRKSIQAEIRQSTDRSTWWKP